MIEQPGHHAQRVVFRGVSKTAQLPSQLLLLTGRDPPDLIARGSLAAGAQLSDADISRLGAVRYRRPRRQYGRRGKRPQVALPNRRDPLRCGASYGVAEIHGSLSEVSLLSHQVTSSPHSSSPRRPYGVIRVRHGAVLSGCARLRDRRHRRPPDKATLPRSSPDCAPSPR
jgi:hypothetical protein